MKNRKYIFCSGLAFSDNKDMNMLHEYALDGWIFRKLKFLVFYELHKEEPQDLIFSYDIQKVKKEEKEDYLAFFEEGGWSLVGKWQNGLNFFVAPTGTIPLHSEVATRSEQYRTSFFVSIVCIALGLLCAYLTTTTRSIWFAAGAGGLLAGGITMAIACYLRVKGKQGNMNVRSYGYYAVQLLFGIGFLICYVLMWDKDIFMLFVLVVALWFIIGSLHGFYRVGKEKQMKERVHHD
ncbi:DUF2812 domain-containing protein [Amedibacillus sp. YH-ame6]